MTKFVVRCCFYNSTKNSEKSKKLHKIKRQNLYIFYVKIT